MPEFIITIYDRVDGAFFDDHDLWSLEAAFSRILKKLFRKLMRAVDNKYACTRSIQRAVESEVYQLSYSSRRHIDPRIHIHALRSVLPAVRKIGNSIKDLSPGPSLDLVLFQIPEGTA